MSWIVVFITWTIAVVGVAFNIDIDGKKKKPYFKRLNWIGAAVLIGITITTTVTVYQSHISRKDNERLKHKNFYLQMTEHTVGPYYDVELTFKKPMLEENFISRYNQRKAATISELKRLEKEEDLSEPDREFMHKMIISSFEGGFIDENSRKNIFENYCFDKPQVVLTLYLNAIDFVANFESQGKVVSGLLLQNRGSHSGDFGVKIKKTHGVGDLFYTEDRMSMDGELDSTFNAGTVYSMVYEFYMMRKAECGSSIELKFAGEPNEHTINQANHKLDQIENIRLSLQFGADEMQWMIFDFDLKDDYTITGKGQRWALRRKICLKELPEISSWWEANGVY